MSKDPRDTTGSGLRLARMPSRVLETAPIDLHRDAVGRNDREIATVINIGSATGTFGAPPRASSEWAV